MSVIRDNKFYSAAILFYLFLLFFYQNKITLFNNIACRTRGSRYIYRVLNRKIRYSYKQSFRPLYRITIVLII